MLKFQTHFSFLNINFSYTWTSFTHTCFVFLLFMSCDKYNFFVQTFHFIFFFFFFWISSSFLKKNFIVCFSQLGFLPFQLLFLMKYQWFNFTSLLFLLNFPRNLFFLLPCLLPFGGIIQKCNNQNFYLSRSYKYCIQVKGISSNIYVFK